MPEAVTPANLAVQSVVLAVGLKVGVIILLVELPVTTLEVLPPVRFPAPLLITVEPVAFLTPPLSWFCIELFKSLFCKPEIASDEGVFKEPTLPITFASSLLLIVVEVGVTPAPVTASTLLFVPCLLNNPRIKSAVPAEAFAIGPVSS